MLLSVVRVLSHKGIRSERKRGRVSVFPKGAVTSDWQTHTVRILVSCFEAPQEGIKSRTVTTDWQTPTLQLVVFELVRAVNNAEHIGYSLQTPPWHRTAQAILFGTHL